ncbi:Uncharacterized protein BP5553_08933 [Venustampulla echinocandica]|uniref:DUF1996 domain-containing protein n=1 Tax=Venustampulla echinocandica TaxID=2656787 RepID=A0A370TDE8_9HELO|nr:Uncharacterized protein BP5553_08933 [Venustampulla echinocandica]RDL32477.1 Uncharacterized protein BP5553_08933 [Venustampulla echinocandica]
MIWSARTLVAFAALGEAVPQFGGGGGSTMLRFGCSQVVIDRIDPLVNPDLLPSPHMHQVIGGDSFNVSMPSADIGNLASCTTCNFADDFSNYWTANLYFKARNGSYKRVPQIPNRLLFNDKFTTQTSGGFVVYYVSPGKGKVTAFKPGFRMLVGDATQRAKKGSGMKSQTCFRCFSGPNFGGDNASPCADAKLDTETLPAGQCLGGIRSNILYPTCWDGKNLDSPDHKSHVAYPSSGPATFTGSSTGGDCPASHPVKIPQIMLEIVWDTKAFNNKADWPADGSQPFVLSTGDPTGYSQHGDYVFGWKGDSLQKAMDGGPCTGASCANLKTQVIDGANKCKVPKRFPENYDGWIDRLPGM